MSLKFEELIKLMEKLRSDDGCPWDREQTKDTIKTTLINEAREVERAVEEKDDENLKEELGDLLWNIVFMSQLAKEEGIFDINDVMDEIRNKIVRRHPHVFGDVKAETAEDAHRFFNEVKMKEKNHSNRELLSKKVSKT
jgi:tetrapyrrole methylase family protein/MazG family protein